MADTVLCAVHGKNRAADCMMETGAGWVCRPGSQCKDRGSGGNKNQLCKFYAEGRCTKGLACPFSHEEGRGMGGPSWAGPYQGKGGKPGKLGKMLEMWGGDGGFGAWGGMWGGKGGAKPHGKGKKSGVETDRATCSVHNKMRRLDCLEETFDGYVCKEGNECQVAGDGGIKKTLCKFFLQGVCNKGEACAFAHSEEEIGTPFSEEALALMANPEPQKEHEEQAICSTHGKKRNANCLMDDGMGGFMCTPEQECKDGSQRTSEVPCRFYSQGKCHRGSDCPFMHPSTSGKGGGKGSKGAKGGKAQAWNPMAAMMSSWGAGGWGDFGMGMPMGMGWGDAWGCGGGCGGGGDWGFGGGPAKKGRKGGKGGEFSWGADEEQVMCQAHGKMRKKSYLVEGTDGFVCKPGSECQVAGEGGVKKAMCKFHEQGNCQRGENCAFAHTSDEIGQPLTDGAIEALQTPLPGKGAEDKAMCGLHGKMRILSSLQEGDEPGNYVCRPGCECKGFASEGGYGAVSSGGLRPRSSPY